MEDDDPAAFTLAILYREAYGLASNLMERQRVGPNAPGRDPATLVARLSVDVAREMGRTDAGREAREAIAEGVADAREGLRPRW